MMFSKHFDSFLKHPIWSKIIANYLQRIIDIIVYSVSTVSTFTVANYIYPGILSFVENDICIKNWVIAIFLITFSFLLAYTSIKLINGKLLKPKWKEYTIRNDYGVVWRWNNLEFEKISNLEPYCPNCDMLLKFTECHDKIIVILGDSPEENPIVPIKFICPDCKKEISSVDESEFIIRDRVTRRIQAKHRALLNKKKEVDI